MYETCSPENYTVRKNFTVGKNNGPFIIGAIRKIQVKPFLLKGKYIFYAQAI